MPSPSGSSTSTTTRAMPNGHSAADRTGVSRRTAGSPGEKSTPTQPPAGYTGFDRLPVAGEYRHGSSGETTADTDPFHGDTLVEIPLAGADDLDDACRSAQQAQRDW